MRVFIVEDEPLVALYVADLIEEAGDVDVRTIGSAKEAIAAAEHWPPEVAIVDVDLGSDEDGVGVAASLNGGS